MFSSFFSTPVKLEQNILLKKINTYLKEKNRPLISEIGHCHGLVWLWLYKFSENKNAWFIRTLKKINSQPDDTITDIEIDIEKFLAHIEWIQNSKKYSSFNQMNLEEILELKMLTQKKTV